MGTHLLIMFSIFRSHIFFLGTGSHKPVVLNALWKRFKMVNNKKMIDANPQFTVQATGVAALTRA